MLWSSHVWNICGERTWKKSSTSRYSHPNSAPSELPFLSSPFLFALFIKKRIRYFPEVYKATFTFAAILILAYSKHSFSFFFFGKNSWTTRTGILTFKFSWLQLVRKHLEILVLRSPRVLTPGLPGFGRWSRIPSVKLHKISRKVARKAKDWEKHHLMSNSRYFYEGITTPQN